MHASTPPSAPVLPRESYMTLGEASSEDIVTELSRPYAHDHEDLTSFEQLYFTNHHAEEE